MIDLKGKRVLVMGLGVHGGGLGVAQWLVKQGAIVTVTDLKKTKELEPSLEALRGLPVEFVLGEHREQDFLKSDLIVRNPAVPRESRWLDLARRHGIPVEMEMGLLLECLPRGSAQVIGITGTKGKTTTTLMVGGILSKANPKTVVAGNLRVSALELLDRIDADTPVVLELSSWQLEAFPPHEASPHLAAITNISPDHLNRYRDLDDYAQAKAVIFRYQQPADFLVLNFDNPILTRFSSRAFSKVVWTSAKKALHEGAFLDRGQLVWRWGNKRFDVLSEDDLSVPGLHNVENALTAIAISAVWGATTEQIASGLRGFKGVEHRQQIVREIRGVRFVDDTTATAPAATIAALQAFSPGAQGIVLIAGGADKELDFDEMARMIVKRVRHVLLLEGSATSRLESAIRAAGGASRLAGRLDNLQDAVLRASELATRGDLVLLSPGCASFGMFANEFERGEQFIRIVNALT